MTRIDLYTSLGYALELLARSDYHRQFPVRGYLDVDILPPLQRGQVRFWLTEEGIPTAMASWAFLSAEVEADVHRTGRALEPHEWACGDRVFFNDWIAPYGNTREVMHDVSHNLFPDAVVTSLRRNPDGSVRRVNRWTGINLRRAREGRET